MYIYMYIYIYVYVYVYISIHREYSPWRSSSVSASCISSCLCNTSSS